VRLKGSIHPLLWEETDLPSLANPRAIYSLEFPLYRSLLDGMTLGLDTHTTKEKSLSTFLSLISLYPLLSLSLSLSPSPSPSLYYFSPRY